MTPIERPPALTGTVLIAVLLLCATYAASLRAAPVVPAMLVHVDGVARPGWYAGGSVGAVLDDAGAHATFADDLPVDGEQVAIAGDSATTMAPGAPAAFLATGLRVHLNTATPAELEALPRIGPALAARIRAARPFRRLADLDRVKGIGPATLKVLAPYVEL